MTSTPSLLDTLDTTVTLEWEDTRTIGTLVEFGGRRVVLTTLRAPEPGKIAYLRIENDEPGEAIAVDGKVSAVSESDWGEQRVEIEIFRVGTTTSVEFLREFLQKHQIQSGGTVSVGRNRDNPDQKRYVYALREISAVIATAAPAPAATVVDFQNPLTSFVPSAAPPAPPQTESTAALTGSAVGDLLGSAPKSGTLQLPDADELLAALEQAARATEPAPASQSMPRPQLAPIPRPPSSNGMDLDATRQFQLPLKPPGPLLGTKSASQPMEFTLPSGPDFDENEQILVQTVDPSSQQAAVVTTLPVRGSKSASGIMSKIFAKKEGAEPPTAGRQGTEAQLASAIFGSDMALRVELAVQFESGAAKKKKLQGTLVRLSESKVRVRATNLPDLYERILIYLPGKVGAKDAIALRCDVMRVRTGENDGAESSFDARVSAAGNSPQVMGRVRQLIQEQGTPPAS